jgi:hypothetical protein
MKEVERIAEIEDNEEQHSAEDKLYTKVLEEISGGNPQWRLLANAALKTKMIPFERWFA